MDTVGRAHRDDWEELGRIDLDAAACAFGDAAEISFSFSLRDHPDSIGAPDGPIRGLALLICCTRADLPLPVEVRRSWNGDVISARMEFVDDVADLDGRWVPIGILKIGSGRCVACDPFCNPSGGVYRFEFDVASGEWIAERFEFGADVLGLRITRKE